MGALLLNGDVVLPDRVCPGTDVLCENGRITAIGLEAAAAASSATVEIDVSDRYVAPGFIDLHIHGTGEFLVENGSADLEALSGMLPGFGVTGFLPTLLPLSSGEDVALLKELSSTECGGARVLDFFLEGPFIKLSGALPEGSLGAPTAERIAGLKAAAEPYRAIFAVSPDLDGIIEQIPAMAAGGTPVFITHTAASVEETRLGIEAGISHATHFYDVFPCPPVNDPGVRPCGAVEAILADPRVSVDFILDGEHVDPVAVQVALACKGPGGVCLVTDANLGAGCAPGRYTGLGGRKVDFAYDGAPARLVDTGGQPGPLAGSGLTMDRAVRSAVSMLEIDIPQAVRMASANPAEVLGLGERKGAVQLGYDADIVILDRDLRVERTFVAGKERFLRV